MTFRPRPVILPSEALEGTSRCFDGATKVLALDMSVETLYSIVGMWGIFHGTHSEAFHMATGYLGR